MAKKENITQDQISFKIIAKTNIDWGINSSINAVEPTIPDPPEFNCTTSVNRISSRSGTCSVLSLG